MTLRNAFENLSVESKQDAAITILSSLLTELNKKLEAGQAIALDATTLAALETISVANPGLTNTELRATPVSVLDTNISGEVLDQQSGAGGVLTFTFASAVDLVVVELDGLTTDVGRVNPFGGVPTASFGIPLRDESPIYIPVTTNSVKVYAGSGTTVNVWGVRK